MLNPVPDVTTPRGLAYLLRHQELWPRGFKWNYSNCDDCGMGLLFEVLSRPMPDDTDACVAAAADILGISCSAAWTIFGFLAIAPDPKRFESMLRTNSPPADAFIGCRKRIVTPELVAAALEDVSW